MRFSLIVASFLLLALPSVAQDKNFFFPVKDFFTPKTNVFVNTLDTAEKAYWEMKTYLSGPDTLFQTLVYDNYGRMTDSIVEKTENGNSLMQSYTMFDYKDEARIPSACIVASAKVFKRDQKMGEKIKWEVDFKNYASGDSCSLTRIRSLMNENDSQRVFVDRMNFMNKKTLESYTYSGIMTYRENKGLVAYTLKLPDGKVKKFILQSGN